MPHPARTTPKQSDFLAIPESPLVYWVGSGVLAFLIQERRLRDVASVLQGLATADDNRCLRFFWEAFHVLPNKNISSNTKISRFSRATYSEQDGRFIPFVKGGGKAKWCGYDNYDCEWEHQGARIRARSSPRIQNEHGFLLPHYTYSRISRGVSSVRAPDAIGIFGDKGPAIVPQNDAMDWIQPLVQSRMATFLLRTVSPNLAFEVNAMAMLPVPESSELSRLHAEQPLHLKRHLVATDPTERSFGGIVEDQAQLNAVAAVLHALEGVNERLVFDAYGVSGEDERAVIEETGTPAGWFPMIAGYDALPPLPAGLAQLNAEISELLNDVHPSSLILHPSAKPRLRALYEAGPGAKESEDAAENDENGGDDEGESTASGAHIPIPTETFLEELSVKLQLHPISIYWLLEELRAEGARCKPEEQRLLEDRLSVLALRLLGHRWPKQIEAGEPVPTWADPDGIIPLTAGTGEATLAERVRARLREEDGDLGVQRTEALLTELTGQSLEEWLRRTFYPRHVRQFKYRPIAWHLASTPAASGKGRRGTRRQPAFECMVYYHACGGDPSTGSGRDVLARLRTQYVDPLIRAERQRAADARRTNDETTAAIATERVQELESFAAQLRAVADEGFTCAELDKLLENEPLDRWSGDGYLGPVARADLMRQERAWRVDLNDGVRVNIAPLQLAGLLAGDVLKAADAKKAIADRARWRSDERRWVREGKLPRCGWMPDDVPESPRWTELAPQREAEQRKLEEKRRAIQQSNAAGDG